MNKFFLLSITISLLLLSTLANAVDSTSTSLRPPTTYKPNAAYLLTTGSYQLACGTDLPFNYNCSYLITADHCLTGFQATATVSPINSGNVGSGKYIRGYRISVPTVLSQSSGYTLIFSEAKVDIDSDPDTGITILYNLYCEPN